MLVRRDARRIGWRIRWRRQQLGMDRATLARRAGLEEGDIRRWESGDPSGLGSDALEVVRRALRCTPAWLMAGEIHPGEYAEALCLDRIIPVIGHFEEMAPETRQRLARLLLFIVVTGEAPKEPGRRETACPGGEEVKGIGGSEGTV